MASRANDGVRQRGRHGQRNSTCEVAFVLSGGAARGAIQVGMLQVLLERGIRPDLIVGTSVGSFNGAWLARHPSVEGMRELERVWTDVRYDHIFSGGPVGVVLNLVQHHPSLYAGDGIRRFLERTAIAGGFVGRQFEDLSVPFAVVATNLTRGRPEVFDSGPLATALLASSAIPAVLPPVTIRGDQYVDGGLLDNVGLRVAIERGAERVYVLDTSVSTDAEKPATTFESVIDRSLQVVMAYHLQSALESFSSQARVIVFRAEHEGITNVNDFRSTAALISAGRQIAEQVLVAPERESAQAILRRKAATWWSASPATRLDRWVSTSSVGKTLAQSWSSSLAIPELIRAVIHAPGDTNRPMRTLSSASPVNAQASHQKHAMG